MAQSKEDKYQCRICKQYFINPATLNQHIKYKHPESLKKTKIDAPQVKDEKAQSLTGRKTDNPEENPISEEALKLEKEELKQDKIKFDQEKQKLQKEKENFNNLRRSEVMEKDLEDRFKKIEGLVSNLSDTVKPVVDKVTQDAEKEKTGKFEKTMDERAEKAVKPLKTRLDTQDKELKILKDEAAKWGIACNTIEECKVMLTDVKKTITPEKKPEEKDKEGKPKTAIPSGYIKDDEHKKMWELLTTCKEPGCGLDYIRKEMTKDSVLRENVVKSLQSKEFELACTTEECKVEREKLLKEHGIEIRKKKGERKGGLLAGGGEEWETL